jgi:processive 1,2-diacylglycerol beta-glucosyltransferase
VPTLMREHHLLIGKAGGAMVQEALAAHLPMLVTQILPGQEEGNARLLIQNGCGVHCPTNESVMQCLRSLFAGSSEGWTRMQAHAKRLGRPDASRFTVRWILSRMASPERTTNEAFGVRPI